MKREYAVVSSFNIRILCCSTFHSCCSFYNDADSSVLFSYDEYVYRFFLWVIHLFHSICFFQSYSILNTINSESNLDSFVCENDNMAKSILDKKESEINSTDYMSYLKDGFDTTFLWRVSPSFSVDFDASASFRPKLRGSDYWPCTIVFQRI